jgi:hypothetical protein
VRDPRDCVASLKRMSWWKRDTYHAVSAWAESIDNLEEATRRWPDAVVPVRYEQLVSETEDELKLLCARLEEDYHPAMTEPEALASVAVPERKHWHSYTRVSPTTARVGSGLAELEPWELALCDKVLAARMERHGYEPAGQGEVSVRQLARFWQVRAGRKLVQAQWRLAERRRRRREPNPVAAQLTSAQRSVSSSPGGVSSRSRLA